MVNQLQIANRRNLATIDIVSTHKEISERVKFLRNGNFFMVWIAGVDLIGYPPSNDMAHCVTTLTVSHLGNFWEINERLLIGLGMKIM
jgi:hypothetical protein